MNIENKSQELTNKYCQQMGQLFNNFTNFQTKKLEPQQILLIKLLKIYQKNQNQLEKNLTLEMRIHIKQLYGKNQKYIELIPIILLKYVMNQFFKEKKSLNQIDQLITQKIQYFGDKFVRKEIPQIKEQQNVKLQIDQVLKSKLKKNLNLFNSTAFFQNIDQLIKAIDDVSDKAKQYQKQLQTFVKEISQQNRGTHYKTNNKLPYQADSSKKFRNYMRIIEKMFEKILQKIDKTQFLNKLQSQLSKFQNTNVKDLSQLIMHAWIQKINQMLSEKAKNNIPIQCFISDFIRGNSFFQSKNDLIWAANSVIKKCQQKNYQIIDIVQRQGRGTHEILFKIRIKVTVAQFQLVRCRQDPQIDILNRQYIHSLYQIRRSPAGSIFGIFLFLSKIKNFFTFQKCEDMLKRLDFDEQERQQFGPQKEVKKIMIQFCKWTIEETEQRKQKKIKGQEQSK